MMAERAQDMWRFGCEQHLLPIVHGDSLALGPTVRNPHRKSHCYSEVWAYLICNGGFSLIFYLASDCFRFFKPLNMSSHKSDPSPPGLCSGDNHHDHSFFQPYTLATPSRA